MTLVKHKNIYIVEPNVEKMTLDEFKKWLETFDVNKDGRISVKELEEAIRSAGKGQWFNRWWMARKGLHMADKNDNGFIEVGEMGHLGEFAKNALGIQVQ